MTDVAESWLWGVAFVMFAFGIGFGFIIAYFTLPGSQRIKELEQEVKNLRQESADYRREVDQHFEKTSEMFHDLTIHYRSFYDHLASGAQKLCADQPNTPRLDIPEAPLLALGQVGEVESQSSNGTHESPAGDVPELNATVNNAEGKSPADEATTSMTGEGATKKEGLEVG
jgi:uncharacterized membrane-anchored protein YhcB (DUF1043 family)